MELTEAQRDAVSELVNIAFARAAASLSALSGCRVDLDVPQVRVLPTAALPDAMAELDGDLVASVRQPFSGPVSGDALLVLNQASALRLADLMNDGPADPLQLSDSARDALAEVGNILLNACLGTFGNLLRLHVTFAVPCLYVERLASLIGAIAGADSGLRHALVVHTGFRLLQEGVSGCLVIVLGIRSIERFVEAVEQWDGEGTA